jgi:hypothetical protein
MENGLIGEEMKNIKMPEFHTLAMNILIEKSITKHNNRDDWGVHEVHCCPKHGCKYGDDTCPVVLGLTTKHSNHCESCEMEEDDPEPFILLTGWIERNHTETTIDYAALEDAINRIYMNPSKFKRDESL